METCVGCALLRRTPPSSYWCRVDNHEMNKLKFLSVDKEGNPQPQDDCPKGKNKK